MFIHGETDLVVSFWRSFVYWHVYTSQTHALSGLFSSQESKIMARLWKWRYQESDTYWRRENIFTFSCLDIFGLIKFGENVSILNTKLIKFSAITPKPFSKKYREERHKRIKKHSVPESVKWNKYHTIHYIKSFVLHFATIELKTDNKPLSFFNLQAFFFFFF